MTKQPQAENTAIAVSLTRAIPFTTELALFRVLTELMGETVCDLPKGGVNDVFYILRPNENVHFFNKIFPQACGLFVVRPANFQTGIWC
jgi:hypothetical protein